MRRKRQLEGIPVSKTTSKEKTRFQPRVRRNPACAPGFPLRLLLLLLLLPGVSAGGPEYAGSPALEGMYACCSLVALLVIYLLMTTRRRGGQDTKRRKVEDAETGTETSAAESSGTSSDDSSSDETERLGLRCHCGRRFTRSGPMAKHKKTCVGKVRFRSCGRFPRVRHLFVVVDVVAAVSGPAGAARSAGAAGGRK